MEHVCWKPGPVAAGGRQRFQELKTKESPKGPRLKDVTKVFHETRQTQELRGQSKEAAITWNDLADSLRRSVQMRDEEDRHWKSMLDEEELLWWRFSNCNLSVQTPVPGKSLKLSAVVHTKHNTPANLNGLLQNFPFGSMTCSQVRPMTLGWPVAPSGGLVQSSHSLSQEDGNGERPENAHLTPPHLRWRRDALQPPEVQRDRLARNT